MTIKQKMDEIVINGFMEQLSFQEIIDKICTFLKELGIDVDTELETKID